MFTDHFLTSLHDFPDQFSKKNYWISPAVFSDEVLKIILATFDEYRAQLRPSMIGKGIKKKKAPVIRNDLITWIEPDDLQFSFLWTLLDELKTKIRQELYVPIKRYEVQLALYPPRHFYLRHVDRHKLLPARVFTFVLYLNEWLEADGGELVLFKGNETITIAPQMNQMIIFASDIEHEVLKTNKDRKSITAWFRDDIL